MHDTTGTAKFIASPSVESANCAFTSFKSVRTVRTSDGVRTPSLLTSRNGDEGDHAPGSVGSTADGAAIKKVKWISYHR